MIDKLSIKLFYFKPEATPILNSVTDYQRRSSNSELFLKAERKIYLQLRYVRAQKLIKPVRKHRRTKGRRCSEKSRALARGLWRWLQPVINHSELKCSEDERRTVILP